MGSNAIVLLKLIFRTAAFVKRLSRIRLKAPDPTNARFSRLRDLADRIGASGLKKRKFNQNYQVGIAHLKSSHRAIGKKLVHKLR